MKRFFISNSPHPCTEIALDANRIRSFYLKNGWEETRDPAQADDLIVSTCAVNQEYEDAAIADIQDRLQQKKTSARLITTGCLSRINPERFAAVGGGEAVPPLEMERFDRLIDAEKSIESVFTHSIRLAEYAHNPFVFRIIKVKMVLAKLSRCFRRRLVPDWMATVPSPDWFFIRGAVGCLGVCTYCAVRRAKGSIISAPIEEILRQVRLAVEKGAREISLAGDDMGAWGTDLGWDLAELLTSILLIPGRFRINLRFIEPVFFLRLFDRLRPVFATGRVSGFCLPLQSGSNRVLAAMKRNYTIEAVEEALQRFAAIPRRPRLASILMVGFPGETEEDFRRTCSLVDRLPIDLFQVLAFEARPNTPAAAMPDQIATEVKTRRLNLLRRTFQLQKIVGLSPGVANSLVGLG